MVHLVAKHIVQVFSQDGSVMKSDLLVDAPAELDEGSESSYSSGDTLGEL